MVCIIWEFMYRAITRVAFWAAVTLPFGQTFAQTPVEARLPAHAVKAFLRDGLLPDTTVWLMLYNPACAPAKAILEQGYAQAVRQGMYYMPVAIHGGAKGAQRAVEGTAYPGPAYYIVGDYDSVQVFRRRLGGRFSQRTVHFFWRPEQSKVIKHGPVEISDARLAAIKRRLRARRPAP